MSQLKGRTVVITGASRGLGEAMAMGCAREGAALVLAARSADDLDRVAASCIAQGAPAAIVVPTDIGDEAQVENLVATATLELDRVDAFIANAAITAPNLAEEPMVTLDSYDFDVASQILRVNTLGTWLCMKHALPALATGGSFVVVGAGFAGFQRRGSGFLGVSKAANSALVRIASAEWADRGIRVNELTPGGMVDTHLFGPSGMPPLLKQRMPVLEPEVIVPAAVWLVGDASSGVTGTSVTAIEFNETH